MHAKWNMNRLDSFLPEHTTFLIDSDTEGTRDFNDIANNLDKKCIFSSTIKSTKDIFSQLFIINEDNNEEIENDNEETEFYESK